MNTLAFKKIILPALLFIGTPLLSMEILSNTDLEELSEDEQAWGNPGPLPFFNQQHDQRNPMRGFGDSHDSMTTSYYQQEYFNTHFIISMHSILTRPLIANPATLTIINTHENQQFTREQQARIIAFYPHVRNLELINVPLTEHEAQEFASHFHKLINFNPRFITITPNNPALSEAWTELTQVLESTQTTQEQLSLFLETVNNYLLLNIAIHTNNFALILNPLLIMRGGASDVRSSSRALDAAIQYPHPTSPINNQGGIYVDSDTHPTRSTDSFGESLTQLTSEVQSFLGELQENCPSTSQEYNTTKQSTVSYTPNEGRPC